MPDDIQKGIAGNITDKSREDDRRIPLVEEIFHNIVKSIKTIAIYKHNKDRFPEFVEPAYRLLEKFLKQNESLVIRVEPYSFRYMNAEVYKNTDQYSNISYRFFRDGVRRITFKQGLSLNEFLQFVLIVSGQSQVSNQAEDTVSQLWLANLENIELTVIEGGVSFSDAEGGENENEKIEMDTIMSFLEQKLASQSNEAIGFARLSASDIGMQLDSVEQIKGLQKKPELIKPEIRQTIQEFFLTENEQTRINRIKRILLAILKSDINDVELQDVLENYVLIMDYILLLDDPAKVAEFLTEIEKESVNTSLTQSSRERLMQLRLRIQQEINTDLRLERIFQLLRNKKIENTESIKTIMDQLNETSYTKIPHFIEQIEIQENLNAVLEILKKPRTNYETIWINLLSSKKMNLVLSALETIKDVEFEGKTDAVLPLLASQVPQIVLKALEIIAADNSEKAEKEIIKYLEQNKISGRDNIIKALNQMNEERQANIILKMLLDENFRLEDSHRLLLYTRMADLIELPQIETYLDSVFNEKGSLFSKGKSDEKKRLLIKALTSSPSLITYQYLIKHSKNENCSDAIKKEILLAADLIKKRLQGK